MYSLARNYSLAYYNLSSVHLVPANKIGGSMTSSVQTKQNTLKSRRVRNLWGYFWWSHQLRHRRRTVRCWYRWHMWNAYRFLSCLCACWGFRTAVECRPKFLRRSCHLAEKLETFAIIHIYYISLKAVLVIKNRKLATNYAHIWTADQAGTERSRYICRCLQSKNIHR